MQKILTIGCTVALVAPLAAQAAEQVVKIGFSSPLSGGQAAIGKDNENGARMAIDQLNQKSLVIGGDKIKFELMNEDDQADPKVGVQVAQKMVDAGVKAVIGPYNSGVAMPASKVYNDANVVLAAIASNPKVTMQGYQYVYRVTPTDSALGGKMAVYAAKELKVKRVAVVDDRTAYGTGIAEEFIKNAKADGIEIVSREFTNDKAVDFNAILTSIKLKKPEAIFYGGMYGQGGPLRRQMKQLGLDIPLMGGDGICSTEMAKLGGATVDQKVLCTVGGVILEDGAEGKDFLARYQKRFNLKPLMYAVSFYDGVNVIAAAMQKANSTDPVKFAPALAAISYKGIAGMYEFDAKRDLKNSPTIVYTFKDGEMVPVKTY
jgi:ABC-type branched-subunit amino acid transport system substrate-binding protein